MFKTEEYANGEIIRWAWAQESDLIPEPFWTSAYLVDGLLIDSGPPAGLENLKQFIESNNLEDAIDRVIITHWHEDHSGGTRYLSQELELPVYMHKNGIDKIRNGFSYPGYRELAWGGPLEPAPKIQPLNFDSISTKAEKYTFDLLHIPGHSVDLVALIEPTQEWAFVSDSIVPKYQMIFGERKEDLQENMEPVYDEMEQIHSSLKKLQKSTSEMEDLTVYTAAFGEFPGREIIAKNIKDIENLHEKVHKLKNDGLDDQEIVVELFGDEHMIGKMTDYALSRSNLVKFLLKWPMAFK